MKLELEIGNLSDKGNVRRNNEDYFGAFSGMYGNLIVVSDGMGGHKGGALASRLSVDTIKEHFESLGKEFNEQDELRKALEKANKKLVEKAQEDDELSDMGATAVILLIKDDQAYTAHLGDSRIYLIREQAIHLLTKDHSLVQQMIDAKIITKEAAKNHPKKNVITRSLGVNGNSTPDIPEAFSLFENDYFILCSDGLTGYVGDDEIKSVVLENNSQTACKILVDMAKDRGGSDNITVQVVKIVKGKPAAVPQTESENKGSSKGFILSASVIGAMIAIFAVLMLTGVIDFKKLFEESFNNMNGLSDTTKTNVNVDIADSLVELDTSVTADTTKIIDTLDTNVPDSLRGAIPNNGPSRQPISDEPDTNNTPNSTPEDGENTSGTPDNNGDIENMDSPDNSVPESPDSSVYFYSL